MRALFVGGSWAGQWHEVAGARRHVVPVTMMDSSDGEELRHFPTYEQAISHESRRYAPMQKQTYLKRTIRNEDGTLNRVEYVLESVE